MNDSSAPAEDKLLARAERIIDTARTEVARAANTAMVQAYWLIGQDIVEVEQIGERRAGYGDALVEQLAARLTARFGAGFGARTLRRMRQFYLTFPNGSNLPRDPDRGTLTDLTPPLPDRTTRPGARGR